MDDGFKSISPPGNSRISSSNEWIVGAAAPAHRCRQAALRRAPRRKIICLRRRPLLPSIWAVPAAAAAAAPIWILILWCGIATDRRSPVEIRALRQSVDIRPLIWIITRRRPVAAAAVRERRRCRRRAAAALWTNCRPLIATSGQDLGKAVRIRDNGIPKRLGHGPQVQLPGPVPGMQKKFFQISWHLI